MAKKKVSTKRLKKSSSSLGSNATTVSRRVRRKTKSTVHASKASRAKNIFFFGAGKADGDRRKRDLLGGKGAGLAEMTNAGLPVPPGFTVSTNVCTLFYEGGQKVSDRIEKEMATHLRRLERVTGFKLGSKTDPLLVSVRSGFLSVDINKRRLKTL